MTYRETYNFFGLAEAYIKMTVGKNNLPAFFICLLNLKEEDGEYDTISQEIKSLGEARANLEGFVSALINNSFHLKNQFSDTSILGWSETYCIMPYPRPESEEIMESLLPA